MVINFVILSKINIVDLVTFHSNKYLTVEGVKIGSGIWKKWNGIYSTNLECIFNILSIWEKSVFSSNFMLILRVFWCFTCKYWGFWVFFINMGHVQGPKNISSKRNQMLKISDQFCFDLKTLIPVSNSTHQIYSTHNLIKTTCVFLWYYRRKTSQTKNPLNSIASPKTSKNDLFVRFTKGVILTPGYRFEVSPVSELKVTKTTVVNR